VKGVISRSRGAAVVFVDESTEEWLADHEAVPGRCSRYRFWWCEIEAYVGSVPVVVPDERDFVQRVAVISSPAAVSPPGALNTQQASRPIG